MAGGVGSAKDERASRLGRCPSLGARRCCRPCLCRMRFERPWIKSDEGRWIKSDEGPWIKSDEGPWIKSDEGRWEGRGRGGTG